jgi:hypothetical protein
MSQIERHELASRTLNVLIRKGLVTSRQRKSAYPRLRQIITRLEKLDQRPEETLLGLVLETFGRRG